MLCKKDSPPPNEPAQACTYCHRWGLRTSLSFPCRRGH